MEGPWCRTRWRRQCRPLLPWMPPTSLLIVLCVAVNIKGVVSCTVTLCEENVCQNNGVCYEMDTAIPIASEEVHMIPKPIGGLKVRAQDTSGGTTHPDSITVSDSIHPRLSDTTADLTIALQKTSMASPPSTPSTNTFPSTTSSTTTTSSITPSHSTTTSNNPFTITARYTASTYSTASRAPSTPSTDRSKPPELEFTVGVLQPTKKTRCPSPYRLIEGFCLYLSDTMQDAEDSLRLCRILGGRLADIGIDDARLLTRLMWPPPRRGLHAWVEGAVGDVSRRGCTAATADTGQLVLRPCGEPHRSLCERPPVRMAPSRPRRSGTSVARLGNTVTKQSCRCEVGYGGEDCGIALDNEEGKFIHCQDEKDDSTIGRKGRQIIIDFGVLGNIPWDNAKIVPPSICDGLNFNFPCRNGCILPSSEATLRYWCQGKEECTPNIEFLHALNPNSCIFGAIGPVSPAPELLFLRYRENKPNSVSQCREGGTYDKKTRTCYVVTPSPGSFNDQRAWCRGIGGDLAYSLDNPKYSGFVDFLRELTRHQLIDIIWVSGVANESRPIVDMTSQSEDPFPCLSLATGILAFCESEFERHAVCALPPWPDKVTPDCPRIQFDEYGLNFPETAPGLTVSQPCGAGYSGTASYTCGLDGQWSSQYPDLSTCRSDDINTDDVKTRLDNGTELVSEVISELSTNVTKRTSQSQPLTSGDVISAVQLLPQMVSAQQAQLNDQPQDPRQVAELYVGNVTDLVSNLTQCETSWHSMLTADRSDTSTVLQTNVEQSAYVLADYLDDEHMDFNYAPIRIRTGRYRSLEGNLEYDTQQGSTVTLPDEVGRFNQSGNTSIVFVEYGNMDCLLSGQKCSSSDEMQQQPDLQYESFVNSPVVSASVGNTAVTFAGSNVTIMFKTRLSASRFNLNNYQCAYWNGRMKNWSTDGCYLGRITNESVECLCNHLTSFATLMDINGVIEEGSLLDMILSWLTYIGCVLSLISLAACLVVFTAIPALRSERTSVHRNLCFCLFTAELILLVGLEPRGSATGCAVVAGLLHFFFLAAFAWMGIEGVQIYLMVYKVFTTRTSCLRYFYICGYGVPAVIVGISLAITKGEGYGSETACWLSTEHGLIWAFAGPMLLVVLVNILALVMALRITARATKGRNTKAPRQASTWIRGSASLVVILGTTWLVGFLYLSNGMVYFSVVFTILNSLQGFFIFLFHCLLNDKNRREAHRFVLRTTNRMGLTDYDLTSSSVGLTSRARTVETSVAGLTVSSRLGTTGTGTGTGTGTNGRPYKTTGANNMNLRVPRHANGNHSPLKRTYGQPRDRGEMPDPAPTGAEPAYQRPRPRRSDFRATFGER